MLFSSLLATAVALGSASAALPEIEVVGNKFYFSNNGSQFLMRGIAYQQDTVNLTSSDGYVDPLADPDTCKRDIPYLQDLNTNIIRVYALDPTKDHTECMKALDDAGIYVIADLSEPKNSIDRNSPAWNTKLLERYTTVVDAFHNYTNILGFFAGNEVTNEANNTVASAYVKAAVRDTKAYLKEKNYRSIPVGYSANDDIAIRVELADYFACGSEDERADFFGINMYSWCGSSTWEQSGYKNLTQYYENLGIPIFFSEYGCNEVQPRKFQEVGTIYSSKMTDTWSGGIVYMYFQETNNYGLVTVSGSSVSTMEDYKYYKSEIHSISPSYASINTASASASATVTSCPAVNNVWRAATALPPTPDSDICECMDKSLTCVIKDSVDSDDYTELFSYLCGSDSGISCDGISGNATTGKYGAYSACESKQKLNFLLNLYYKENGSKDSACDFSGSATTQSATTASSCSAYISSAGESGLGTVTGNILNASGTSGSGSGSGSGSSSKSGSKSGSSSGSTSSSSSSSGSKSGASRASASTNTALLMIGSFMFVTLSLIMV
ncbi:hypothetical protein CJJ07_002006 [Candidozyma auris]|nr:hypothetical protein CJJ07_002006 [[Candida] auris]QEL60254.1 hypothetical protein CJJ09_002352 [[Candida] auris]